MKRVVMSLLIVPAIGLAQTGLEAELNQEIDQMYAQQAQQVVQEQIVEAPNSTATAGPGTIVLVNRPSATSTNAQPVIQQPVQQPVQYVNPYQLAPVQQAPKVQQQPTTLVSGNPLTESRADKMRQQRQNLELETELQIVEKLESSRMEDEKRRAQKLFGERFDALDEKDIVQPETVDVDQAQQADITSEIQAAVAELKSDINKEELPKKEEKSDRVYFMGASAGVFEVPDAENVEARGALGFSFGMQQKRLVVDGFFNYATYEVEHGFPQSNLQNQFGFGYNNYNYNPYLNTGFGGAYIPQITEVDHYQLGAAVKYQILGGIIRPNVGVALSYNYREFEPVQFLWNAEEEESHAIDVGAVVGVDLAFSDDFSIGLDFRYYTNVTSWEGEDDDFEFEYPEFEDTEPIEEIDYYMMSLTGRFSF